MIRCPSRPFHLPALLAAAALALPAALAGATGSEAAPAEGAGHPAALPSPGAGPAPAAPEAAATSAIPLSFGGMVAAIDPATGRLRQPTPAEVEALRTELAARVSASPHRDSAPANVHFADGTVMAELDPELHSFTVVRTAPDGTKVLDCAGGATASHALMSQPAAPAPAPEEK